MKTHVAMVHEKKKPFKCDICYYSCSLKSTMKIHVASVHEEKKAIQMWHLWLQLFFLFVCSDLAISMSKWIICVICDPASKLKSCEILLLGPLYVKKNIHIAFPHFETAAECAWKKMLIACDFVTIAFARCLYRLERHSEIFFIKNDQTKHFSEHCTKISILRQIS